MESYYTFEGLYLQVYVEREKSLDTVPIALNHIGTGIKSTGYASTSLLDLLLVDNFDLVAISYLS